MSAIWLRARAEIRGRRRALLSAAILCGLVGAAVLTTLAGARRVQAIYPRFLETHRAFDIQLSDTSFFYGVFWKPDFDALARLPYVEAAVEVFMGGVGGDLESDLPEGGLFIGSTDPDFMRTIHRPTVVEGRLPNQASEDEVAVPFFAEDDLAKFHLGDRKRLQVGDRLVEVTVVGRTVFPGELPPGPQFGFPMLVSPAFLERYRSQVGFSLPTIMIRFQQRSDAVRFQRDVRAIAAGKIVSPQEQDSHARAVQGSTNLQASALRLVALFAGLTGALIVGQLLAREFALGAEDTGVLRALGFGRSQLFLIGMLRVAPVALGGSALALVAAWLASPLLPRGTVRTIMTSQAPVFDGSILGVGAACIAAVVMLVVIVPAWRAAGAAGRARQTPDRPSRIASLVSAAGMSTPAITGARLALERGRGRTAVPVFSSLAVVSLGVAAFIAATTFASSLDGINVRPALYGKTWDAVITSWSSGEPPEDDSVPRATAAALLQDPDITALAFADSGIPFRVFSPRGPSRGVPVSGISVENLKGSLLAPIVEGRAPERPDEVALGARMIRELGIRLDPLRPPTIQLALQGNDDHRLPFRVVGRAVIPPLGSFGEIGYGVTLVSEENLVELLAEGDRAPVVTELLVRLRPGVTVEEVVARYKTRFPTMDEGDEISIGTFADAVNFGGVQGAPLLVGGLLAALGAGALAHVLVTAIRRRRRDIAILKTMGFVRGQARRAVAWQSTFTVLVATAIGVPLGVIGGRWLWIRVADNLGALPRPEVNMRVLVFLVPAVIVLANLIAALPGRSAARTKPALVLRSE